MGANLVAWGDEWKCNECDLLGVCEICESCAEHCCVKTPNDLAAHRRFDYVIAATDPKHQPN